MVPTRAIARGLVAGLVACALILMGDSSPAVALSVIATIPVGAMPSWVTLDPTTNQLYVANFDAGSVSVINGNTDQTVTTIPTGSQTRSVALNLATNLGYVTNAQSNTVSVVDLSQNQVTATIPATGAWHVAINSATNRGYVTQTGLNQVGVIDLTTNKLFTSLPAANNPLDVIVNSATNLVYVTVGSPVQTTAEVLVFDGSTNQLVGSIPFGTSSGQPDRLSMNPQTDRLYVSDQVDNLLVVIDVNPNDSTYNQVLTAISLPGVPDGIAVDQTTNQIYVGDISAPYWLWQIDGSSNLIVNEIVPGTQPLGVAVNATAGLVYTANAGDNTVSVIQMSAVSPRAYLPLITSQGSAQ